jgi:hypothetical protein
MSRTLVLLALLSAGAAAPQERILWRDPGAVEQIDFNHPAGGARNHPRPPFHFIAEELTGSNPKVLVRDAAGSTWRIKGGLEIKSESFATRFVSALGYYADPTCFVAQGQVRDAGRLKRAAGLIGAQGEFTNAAFERREDGLRYMQQDWMWNHNPFAGTRELQGLKIVMMLLSNWDNKDARERRIGSNTGIFGQRVNGRYRFLYFVNDWGQTLGGWGSEMRTKAWDCRTFTAQTAEFVQGRQGEKVRFGFVGLHTDDFKNDITVEDVRWLLRYLGRISDAQLRAGLTASGATAPETDCFAAAVRARIEQLRKLAADPPPVARIRP